MPAAPVFQSLVAEFLNPEFRTPPLFDARGFALSHYAGNSRVFDYDERRSFSQASSDASGTFLIGEVNSQFMAWGNPANMRDPRNGIMTADGFGGAAHTHGAQFAMLDGSVQFFSADIDPQVLRALSGPGGDSAAQPSESGGENR